TATEQARRHHDDQRDRANYRHDGKCHDTRPPRRAMRPALIGTLLCRADQAADTPPSWSTRVTLHGAPARACAHDMSVRADIKGVLLGLGQRLMRESSKSRAESCR